MKLGPGKFRAGCLLAFSQGARGTHVKHDPIWPYHARKKTSASGEASGVGTLCFSLLFATDFGGRNVLHNT